MPPLSQVCPTQNIPFFIPTHSLTRSPGFASRCVGVDIDGSGRSHGGGLAVCERDENLAFLRFINSFASV